MMLDGLAAPSSIILKSLTVYFEFAKLSRTSRQQQDGNNNESCCESQCSSIDDSLLTQG